MTFSKRPTRKKANGVTSFAGVHQKTQTSIDPKIHIPLPINDLYGPHMHFIGPNNAIVDKSTTEEK